MILAENYKMIETFDLERLEPAFDVRVHVRRPEAGSYYFHVLAFKDAVETSREVWIVVANQMRRLVAFVLEDHRQVASLLSRKALVGLVVILALTTRREPTWMKNSTK